MASWARQTDPEPYETVELIVSGIIPIILIIIGTFGNLLGIFVLLKKQNRRTSTNIYLMLFINFLMENIRLPINQRFFVNPVDSYHFIHCIHQLCFSHWFHLIEPVFSGVDGINRK